MAISCTVSNISGGLNKTAPLVEESGDLALETLLEEGLLGSNPISRLTRCNMAGRRYDTPSGHTLNGSLKVDRQFGWILVCSSVFRGSRVLVERREGRRVVKVENGLGFLWERNGGRRLTQSSEDRERWRGDREGDSELGSHAETIKFVSGAQMLTTKN